LLKSIVLLSGGLDSSVALAQALRETRVQLCLTIDYGQLSAANEIKSSATLTKYYNLKHEVLQLPFLKKLTKTALVKDNMNLPKPELDMLDDLNSSQKSAKEVWVPNRNGLFINIAACYAEAMGCDYIVAGFNKEEAATFPDNSFDFVKKTNEVLTYSTLKEIRLVSYTLQLNKSEIVKLGQKLGVPWQYIWSCYGSGNTMCGKCESCRRFYRAFAKAGVKLKI